MDIAQTVVWSIHNSLIKIEFNILDYTQYETMSVGVKSFDDDHKQLIDAINLVLSLTMESSVIGSVSTTATTIVPFYMILND